jgi:biotin carboxyl carrier protein
MAGTFYRAASPGAKPFVEVGTEVSVDDTVCLIEVMKLFKSVSGGAAGRVAAILVPDSAPVANQQPLMLIEPVRS